ncbi:MAG: 30S ribosomal protein S18 [Patescibacteria group bacterium]
MIQNYEIYIIFNPELSTDQVNQKQDLVVDLLKSNLQAENISEKAEGLKKMAYPISKHRTGFYLLITFDSDISLVKNISTIEKKLNLDESILRYIIVNQTEFLKQVAKENRSDSEISNHRELNKGKNTKKKCISKYLGLRVIDYKDVNYLNQFTSPYAKIFTRTRTGTSSKFQRKINKAIKRARHMALMPFTPIHNS